MKLHFLQIIGSVMYVSNTSEKNNKSVVGKFNNTLILCKLLHGVFNTMRFSEQKRTNEKQTKAPDLVPKFEVGVLAFPQQPRLKSVISPEQRWNKRRGFRNKQEQTEALGLVPNFESGGVLGKCTYHTV